MDAEVSSADVPEPEVPGALQRRSRTSGIDRALQVFDYLQATGRPATAYDIARNLGAPVSTVYMIIDDLVRKRMLARADGNMIWLGARLFHYGLAYARSVDLLAIATEEMQALARDAGQSVQICGRDADSMVVFAMAEGPGHFRVTSRVGTRVPLNWTASGRLLVGHLPRAERMALFRRSARSSVTGRAPTDAAALADAAETALRERHCIQLSESDLSVACVAAPVVDATGECVVTISIVLPEESVHRDRGQLVMKVQQAAQRIEERMGFRTPASAPINHSRQRSPRSPR